MSRRNRRQTEELADLSANAGALVEAAEGEDDADDLEQSTSEGRKTSTFAALSADTAAEEEAEEADDFTETISSANRSRPKKKKKRKAAASKAIANDHNVVEPDEPPSSTTPAATPVTASTKRSKSKAKLKQPKQSHEDVGLDEVDKAVRDLGLSQPDHTDVATSTASTSSHIQPSTSRFRMLLTIDKNQLDPQEELKRFFGAKVVASAVVKPQVVGARHNNPHHALGRQFGKGGMLAKPQQSWPPAALSKSGLTMKVVHAGDTDTLWTFEHSNAYKEITQMWLEAVESMDPNSLMALLHVHPYHVELLLSLADMAGQQGDPGMSQDFLDRALYAFERAFAPNFNIANGNVRLDFDRIESRGFLRALDLRIHSLIKRGTWRTLHEHTRLLYAVSPYDDPYGALLLLDFTAPKSRQYRWLIDFAVELPKVLALGDGGNHGHLRIATYPGLVFAKALCRWHMEEDAKLSHKESTDELQIAILRYPLTLRLLLDKLGSRVPREIAALPHSKPESGFSAKSSYLLQLLSALYVHRSDTLWKEPEILEWMQKTVQHTAPIFSSDPFHEDVQIGKSIYQTSPYPGNVVPQGIYRHILVSDIAPLRAFLPSRVLNSMQLFSDPLPPGPGFDNAYFRTMYDGNGRKGQQRHEQNASHGFQGEPRLDHHMFEQGLEHLLANYARPDLGAERQGQATLEQLQEMQQDMADFRAGFLANDREDGNDNVVGDAAPSTDVEEGFINAPLEIDGDEARDGAAAPAPSGLLGYLRNLLQR